MIEVFKPGDEAEVSELIRRAFETFIAPDYSEKGLKTFRDYTSPYAILERCNAGDLMLCFKEGKKIVGIIELRDQCHICLFFVDPDFHKRGIGGALMDELIRRLSGKSGSITVNASLYAEKIYRKLGFRVTGEREEKDGIRHIPMKMFLSSEED